MVKPWRTLLLLFYIGCLVAVVAVMSPGELALGTETALKIPTVTDLFPSPEADTTGPVDMSRFEAIAKRLEQEGQGGATTDPADSLPTPSDSQPKPNLLGTEPPPDNDSLIRRRFGVDTSLAEKSEQIGEPQLTIQYPDSLSPANLDRFFGSLQNIAQQRSLVRIVHYGDSQIEGDRISEFLRSRLQRRFGGCGVGMVPLLERQTSRTTLRTENGPNWAKLAAYGNDNKPNRAGRYGPLVTAYRFSPPTLPSQTPQNYRSWVRYRSTNYSTEPENWTQIQNVKILYSSPYGPVKASVQVDNDSLPLARTLERAPGLNLAQQPVTANFQKLLLKLEGPEGAEFYSVALDCNEGVAVDNVPMRGSAGIEFTKTNIDYLRQQLRALNVKLVILQFGVNVVPGMVKDYTFYENLLYKQLLHFKAAAPELDILVVGVSDMARRSGTGYASYPNVPRIRDAQRRAAFRAGCAFWDLYSAMGGPNSMVAWVKQSPPLAGRDYTHFNPRGARVVGEMLYEALMKDYENYRQRNRVTQ